MQETLRRTDLQMEIDEDFILGNASLSISYLYECGMHGLDFIFALQLTFKILYTILNDPIVLIYYLHFNYRYL